MRGNSVELKDLKQFKEYLDKLDETKPIEFKTVDGKVFTFYGIAHGGVVSSETKTVVIPQSVILQEVI